MTGGDLPFTMGETFLPMSGLTCVAHPKPF